MIKKIQDYIWGTISWYRFSRVCLWFHKTILVGQVFGIFLIGDAIFLKQTKTVCTYFDSEKPKLIHDSIDIDSDDAFTPETKSYPTNKKGAAVQRILLN